MFQIHSIPHRLRWILPIIAVCLMGGSVTAQEMAKKTVNEAAESAVRTAVFPSDSPDPTAIESPDGYTYVFTTGPGIRIFRSRNLVDWESAGRVFDGIAPTWAMEKIPGARNVWAPDITFHDGRYRLYYSISTFGSQRSVIGTATCVTLDPASPDHGWTDEGIVLESDPRFTDYNAIDSATFVDEDGRMYLFWGSYWTGLKGLEVDPATGKPTTYRDPAETDGLRIVASETAVARRSGSDTSLEAAYVVRRGAYYWLFTSRGSCCDGVRSTYHIVVGRAEKPLGPYVGRQERRLDEGFGTPLLESTQRWKGTGHNGVFQTTDPDGVKRDWLILAAYDARAPQRGRLTQIRPLRFPNDADGWVETDDVFTLPAK